MYYSGAVKINTREDAHRHNLKVEMTLIKLTAKLGSQASIYYIYYTYKYNT